MRNRSKLAALTGGIVMALVAPLSAQASTKEVYMGTPPSVQKTFNEKYGIDVNDFFPHAITVHAGDSVRFVPAGFHSLNLAPKGGAALLPLFVPTGQKVLGATDAAGSPFWFNGQDQLGLHPDLADPSKALFGKRATYNGTARVESGLPLANKPKPVTVRFTKKGTFTYRCDVHPGMKGQVHVVGRSASAPSARSDARVVKRMVARDLAIGKQLAKKTVPAGVVDVGEAGPFGVEYFQFLPRNLTVTPGTTIRFQMTKGSFEAHTATSGPGDPEKEPDSFLGRLAASFESPALDQAAAYPSDPPGTPASLTPQIHGNGFWNSGVLDTAASSPLPPDNSVRFDAPGTYEFYCLIHPFMHGRVVVTG